MIGPFYFGSQRKFIAPVASGTATSCTIAMRKPDGTETIYATTLTADGWETTTEVTLDASGWWEYFAAYFANGNTTTPSETVSQHFKVHPQGFTTPY